MRFAKSHSQNQEDTRKVKTQTTRQTVEVRADGEGLVSHAGAFLLVDLADRLGLTAALGEAMAPTRERRSAHDPGVVIRDLAVAIADGGDHVSDLGVLRGQEALFGAVASETTAHRVIKAIDAQALEALRGARAVALARAWDAGARPEELILDIDASLLTAHSEKESAAGTYKGGFGFFPLLCYLSETGEPLAALLRPGNAGANTAADHLAAGGRGRRHRARGRRGGGAERRRRPCRLARGHAADLPPRAPPSRCPALGPRLRDRLPPQRLHHRPARR